MKSFFSVMLKCRDEIYKKRDRSSAEAYLKVKEFVEGVSYSSCKKAYDIVRLTLEGHNAHYLADYFNVSYDTIRTEKRHISEDLWRLFPSDFFEKLSEYSKNREFIDDCLYSLRESDLKSTDILFMDFVNSVKSVKGVVLGEEFNPSTFREELHLLKLYSKLYIDSDLKKVDISKLRYLVDVLDGKSGNIREKALILKFIKEDED